VSHDQLNFFHHQFNRAKEFCATKFTIFIYLLIGILSLDTVISVLSAGLGISVSSFIGVVIFVVSAIITIVCQLFILQFVSRASFSVRSRARHIRLMHVGVTVSQYFVITIFIYVILDILLTSSYSSISSLLVTTVSYMVSILLMGIFTVIFLSWYKINRSSVLVLLYGLSFATAVIGSISLLTAWMYVFIEQMPVTILPGSDVYYLQIEEGSYWKIFSKIYQHSDIVSFFLKWGGTALVLYHYSRKIGKIKYWVLLSLPVAYFSLVIIYHLHIYEPHEELETLIFYGLGSIYATFGGILFYLAFLLTSKNFSSNKVFRNYLLMAGFGFMLFFSGSQGNVITTVYPPFGLATVSTYSLGTYLIVLGLYLSALSVAQDEQLRNMIKRSTMSESKFLHSIGTSAGERRKEIESTVLEKAKRQQATIVSDIGIGTSLTEEDIKSYVKEVEEEEKQEVEQEQELEEEKQKEEE
jgi:hypothetical protein